MKSSIVKKSRELMYQQTLKHKAPAWGLTEIAIAKGNELAKKYEVDERLVLTALYLAHTVFSTEIHGRIQKHHEELSAKFSEVFLKKWKVAEKDRKIVLNAIKAHHNKAKSASKEAEVMKNAECFKFLTMRGVLIYLHDLASRGVPFADAVKEAQNKARQKLAYVSLKSEKNQARQNYRRILKILGA